MIKENFKEKDLPLNELEVLGLAKDGKLKMDKENLNALLSGNRTDFIRLTNLTSGGTEIDRLDAKLSLRQDGKGKVGLLLHPIYKTAEAPKYLTDLQISQLKSGVVANVAIETGTKIDKKPMFVEYDKETNEFIRIDSAKIVAPESANNQNLTPEQKKNFKEGQEVILPDGLKIQATAKNKKGISSNRPFLVLSLLLDGGLSFIIFKTIEAVKKRNEKLEYTKGYNAAMQEILKAQKIKNIPVNFTQKSSVVLRDFKEYDSKIKTTDLVDTVNHRIDATNLKMEPKHLDTLANVKETTNLRDVLTKVDPINNRNIAKELREPIDQDLLIVKGPEQIKNDTQQAEQLEHFANLSEVLAMIEQKRDYVLDYIQETGKGISDQDYLKDVVTGISDQISPQVRNVANQSVNENNTVLETTLDDAKEQTSVETENEELDHEHRTGVKR